MYSFKTASLALLLALAPVAEANMTKEKMDFIRHMRQAERKGPIKISRPSLAKYLQKASISNLKGGVVTEASKKKAEGEMDYYDKFHAILDRKAQETRSLEENADDNPYDNNIYADEFENWGNQTNNTNSHNYQQWLSDNWNMIKSMFRNEDNDQMYSDQNTTYDVASLNDFSMKYAGCSSTSGVDEDGQTFNNLIKFRLCPTESCQDDSWQGCNTEYGDYAMDLQGFLEIQSDVREEEVKLLCQYCESCYYFNRYYCADVYQYDADYNGGDNSCCVHTDDCMEYNKLCENDEMGYDEDGDDDTYGQYTEYPDYDELFQCKEVDLADFEYRYQYLEQQYYNNGEQNYYQNYGYHNNGEQNNGNDNDGYAVGYLGVHCDNDAIEIGLFLDDACTVLYQDQTQQQTLNFTELAQQDFNSEDIEDLFIADTCVMCGGEDYNSKVQWWYIEDDRGEYDDEDAVNEMCTEMYQASAKCNAHLDEDVSDLFEQTDTETANEAVTCTFVNLIMHNDITSEGMVFAADDVDCTNLSNVQCLLKKFKKLNHAAPAYTQAAGNPVTGMQVAALTIGVVGTAAMAVAAFHLKQQIGAGGTEGLITNEVLSPGTPSQVRQLD
jgi:hypothetical protein